MTTRASARATALGVSMTMTMTVLAAAPGCTDDADEPAEPQGLTGATDPIVIGDGSETTEDNPAAIEFRFDPILIEDGRVFETIKLIPQFGAEAAWDPATLDETNPDTFPPASFAFAVEIRDLQGELILASDPHQFYPADFAVPEDGNLPSPFASATWTYYELSGCAYEIDPLAEGAAAWLSQLEGFLFEIASTDWDFVADPVPDNPTPEPVEPVVVIAEDDTAATDGLVREIPHGDETWAELLMICWDAANEAWHWYKIFKEKCYKGNPPKFTMSWDCGWAISGMTNKFIQAAACAYMMADKLGIVPTSEGTKKLLRLLLVSYALSGRPQNVPKLPPPPEIRKPK